VDAELPGEKEVSIKIPGEVEKNFHFFSWYHDLIRILFTHPEPATEERYNHPRQNRLRDRILRAIDCLISRHLSFSRIFIFSKINDSSLPGACLAADRVDRFVSLIRMTLWG